MHRYATLWIDATQVPPELRRYAVLASLSPKGKLRYEGGKWSDGRMAILEENRVKGTYTHYFDDELFGRNREHTLRLTATDGAGNTRVWEGTYYR